MNWAKSDNTLIRDLKDFTATFFQKHTLLNVLLNYSVFDVSDTLLVMRPYQRFSPDSVNGSDSTAGLKRNLDKDDNKIIVTTIQKLNNLMKSEADLPIYNKQVVFIFDECHRSQFGEAQKNLKKKFKKFCQFGFTGRL